MPVSIFGDHDAATVTQLENCVAAEEGAEGVLCADGHLGYSMPIGGGGSAREPTSPRPASASTSRAATRPRAPS
jgi:hypothetical protein